MQAAAIGQPAAAQAAWQQGEKGIEVGAAGCLGAHNKKAPLSFLEARGRGLNT